MEPRDPFTSVVWILHCFFFTTCSHVEVTGSYFFPLGMNVCFSVKGLFRGGKKKLDFAWEGEFSSLNRMSGFRSFVCVCSVEATSYWKLVGFFLLLLWYFYSREDLWMSPTFEAWICNIKTRRRIGVSRKEKFISSGECVFCFHSTYKLRTLNVKPTRSPLTVSEWLIKCLSKIYFLKSYFFPIFSRSCFWNFGGCWRQLRFFSRVNCRSQIKKKFACAIRRVWTSKKPKVTRRETISITSLSCSPFFSRSLSLTQTR